MDSLVFIYDANKCTYVTYREMHLDFSNNKNKTVIILWRLMVMPIRLVSCVNN